MKTELVKMILIFFNVSVLLLIFVLFARKSGVKIIILILAILFTQYVVYADVRYLEPNWIQVQKLTIASERFPENSHLLKIVQISDLHITRDGFRERSMVSKVNSLKPDAILITGDFINREQDLPVVLSVLSRLHAKKGIYGIFGNSDHASFHGEKISRLAAALESIGVHILNNDNVRIPIDNKNGLWVIGLGGENMDDYAKRSAFSGINFREPKIIIVHYPKAMDHGYINTQNADLVLAGDTHGGQVGIRYLRAFSNQAGDLEYVSGLYNVHGVPLYVNRGIGMSDKDIRFFCRPEITVIKLSSKG